MVKKIIILAVIMILLVIIKNTVFSMVTLLNNAGYSQKLENQLNTEQQKNKFLKERLSYVKTNQFVEDVAREKLGFTKPGEKIVILPKKGEKTNEQQAEDKPNWQKWWEMFF